MSRYCVISDPVAAFDYINQQFHLDWTPDLKGLVQTRDGKIIAAAAFTNYTGSNIFIHVASDGTRRWLTRHALHEVFKYPFVTAGCRRITLWIEADNYRSRGFAMALGFAPEATLKHAGRDGQDVLIYRMFREECRYA